MHNSGLTVLLHKLQFSMTTFSELGIKSFYIKALKELNIITPPLFPNMATANL